MFSGCWPSSEPRIRFLDAPEPDGPDAGALALAELRYWAPATTASRNAAQAISFLIWVSLFIEGHQ